MLLCYYGHDDATGCKTAHSGSGDGRSCNLIELNYLYIPLYKNIENQKVFEGGGFHFVLVFYFTFFADMAA